MTYVGQVRKPPAALFWVVFAVTVAAAWAALLDMSLGFAGPVRELGPGMAIFEPVQWLGQLCAAGAELQRLEMLSAMWALMVVAMMGPAAMPHLVAYSRMGSRGGRGPSALSLAALAGGYLAVWILYAVGAAGIQFILSRAALVEGGGTVKTSWLAMILLALAAGWQWTAWKRACLARCRDPFSFFLSRWRGGVAGAFRMGLRQGLICVACCWALMLLTLVGGVMNVLWMAGATALMVAEKFPDPGDRLRRALGVGLAGGAVAAGLGGMGLFQGG